MNVSRFLGGAALAVLAASLMPGVAAAQQESGQPAAATQDGENGEAEQRANDIIVTGEIFFRNRTTDPNPVLSYDLEYFQKFEPVSVGEMLKRVPGVTFTSDVLEYDQPQFRGLPPGYTQVLINGRRAPGGESDRSFFVDRIPAELVERIEIVRAPRADQPSEGAAGTLNIITKESASFEGGFAKAGALINGRDGKTRPSGAVAYAGHISDSTDFWGALNYQERRNPKKKVSYRFDDVAVTDDKRFPDGLNSKYISDPEFNNFEAQSDTRDGSDLSGSAEISTRFGDGGHFRLGGFFVDTDRNEDETSLTYEGSDLDFDGVETQHEEIDQQTYAVTGDALIPLGDFKLGVAGGWNAYRDHTDALASEGGEEDQSDLELVEVESTRVKDDEFTGTLFLRYGDGGAFKVKGGIDLLSKKRTGSNSVFDVEDDETEINNAATFKIDEKRYDPYLRLTFEPTSEISIDAGLRYEITDRDVTGVDGTASYNTSQLNPSLHLRYAPTARDQFRASVARTVRRPDYDLISPYEQEESPGDDDISYGNPSLKNEQSWGADVGYERRLGAKGIVGVNFFYRDIKDLIELVRVGDVLDDEDDPTSDVIGGRFTPRNIGDGQTWGVEVDFSTPINIFGFGETGLFANYTYLDSKTNDPATGEERRFNNQPHHIYNVGFIQNVAPADLSFGATISGRSSAFESNFDETVNLRYDPDLEAFVEKRIGKHIVVRFSAQNLLDRVKKEDFRKYDGDSLTEILAARAAGDIDEYEIEREHAGPLFQATLRAAF
ncbi:TonB-dependent receptor [Sphingomonas sp. JC676]|uniref:TonB-dependent receptor plug domain-containing protein n=1 Tax=Sphingomonas sp. JC676 TaxID=2768065 RepID=UPI0016586538|nr:TonB-dependent receptor [Sphingomonas sp. JC676]MBC9032449.1 TonB-dependent receptor [Sphingomonas sp. JC676]